MICAFFEDWGASRTKLSGFLCNLGIADELSTLPSSLRFSHPLFTLLITYLTSSVYFLAGTSGL